ncbi:MAG: 3D domain-containing protein [Clostridiales Family XIII bacterium]|jgi:3D (Asp-Asp-Asp) domain-containing protein|nr:3D domain-containing protein [Clostridiales Family XIII bacterium]
MIRELWAFLRSKEFWKYYLQRFGAIAAAGSVIGVFALFGFTVPASAAVPQEPVQAFEKALGGVEIQRQDLHSVERPKRPIYGGPTVPLGTVSPDLMTLTAADTNETLQYVGTFRITHYCACEKCCGKSNGITASGTHVSEQTVAADWSVFPVGSVLYIKRGDSLVRKVVEDRGGGVNGQHIDVYVPSHEQALQMGTYSADIYIPVA